MRTFKEIQKELGLRKFLYSENGTLHFPTDVSKRVIVRHFDNKINKELVPVYVDIMKALDQFAQENDELNSLIIVQQPFEVGVDFIARTHHVYYISVDSYFDDDEDCETPPQFEKLKKLILELKKNNLKDSDKILLRILENSFIIPTMKTYFKSKLGKFINVDPKMDIEDLTEWQAAIQENC